MRRQKLVVTGFGPFPSMPRNPSAALARSVAAAPRWRILGVEVRCRILTTAYATLGRELDPLLREKPDAVLLIGVAGRARLVRVESRATSRRSILFPDVEGTRAEKPNAGAVTVRRTKLPPGKALLALRRNRIESRISRDAGRYLCNASYFRALSAPSTAVFIHIPKTPRLRKSQGAGRKPRAPRAERLRAALVEIARELLLEARARRVR